MIPEYVLMEFQLEDDTLYLEPVPAVGENPATDPSWYEGYQITIFSKHAKRLGAYLVMQVFTYGGTQSNPKYYNTQVAFDDTGKVVAVHHKFNLFGSEPQTYTAGSDVTTFEMEMGTVGLLICADIYGSHSLLNKLSATLDADLVAVSSFWTVSSPWSWYKDYADDYNVYAVVANTTNSPGYGGGVYSPSGSTLAQEASTSPSVVVYDLPLPGYMP